MNPYRNVPIPQEMYSILRKQRYQIRDHTGVKLCGWVKRSLLEGKNCYKSKFYGIETHRCIQCTPSVIWCQQSCIFCWRVLPLDIGISQLSQDSVMWKEPGEVLEDILKMHRKCIMGYKGILDRIGKKRFKELLNPRHVAISLSGEPTIYPYLGELIDLFHKRGFSTFVVSNGILTDIIQEIEPTQLYISLDAYDLESYKKICGGREKHWQRILDTLDILRSKGRTCIRTTLVRGYNSNIERFIPLYERADVHFIEIKSYMNVGYSRKRLTLEHMLKHEEVLELGRYVEKLSHYKLVDESYDSRVVLLVNEDREIERFIGCFIDSNKRNI